MAQGDRGVRRGRRPAADAGAVRGGSQRKRRGSVWRDRPASVTGRASDSFLLSIWSTPNLDGRLLPPPELARRSGEELQGTDGDKGEYSEDDQAALDGRDEERAHQVAAGQPPQLPSHH